MKSNLIKLESDIEYDKGLLIGEKAPNLILFDKSNRQINIVSGQNNLPTILYIFTLSCPFCIENLHSVNKLYENTVEKSNFVAISLQSDDLEKYTTDNNFPFPVYHSPPKEVFRSFKMGKTPQTYVLSKDGYVIGNWSGSYSGNNKEEIEKFFNIRLPEIKVER